MSDITPLWGAGHGSKRHYATGIGRDSAGRRSGYSACGRWIVEFADDSGPSALDVRRTAAEYVASLLPCTRCAKAAIKEEAQA